MLNWYRFVLLIISLQRVFATLIWARHNVHDGQQGHSSLLQVLASFCAYAPLTIWQRWSRSSHMSASGTWSGCHNHAEMMPPGLGLLATGSCITAFMPRLPGPVQYAVNLSRKSNTVITGPPVNSWISAIDFPRPLTRFCKQFFLTGAIAVSCCSGSG